MSGCVVVWSTGVDVLSGCGEMNSCVWIGVLVSGAELVGTGVLSDLSTMFENWVLLCGVELTGMIGIAVLLCSAELACMMGSWISFVDV